MSKELPGNVQTLGTICIGWMILLCGLAPFLSAIDVIPSRDADFGAPRPIVAVIGLLIASPGAWILALVLRCLVREYAPEKNQSFPLRLFGFLFSRVGWKQFGAAAPHLILAVQMFVAWRYNYVVPDLKADALIPVMGIEFVVIHSTAFLGFAALIKWEGWGRFLKIGCFGVLLAIYVGITAGNISWSAAGIFLYLTAAKFLGYRMNSPTDHKKTMIGLRWFVTFLLFMSIGMCFEDRSLKGPSNVPFGFFYFTVLGLFELFDFYNLSLKGKLRWKAANHRR